MEGAPTWDLESICPDGPGGTAFKTRRTALAGRLESLHGRIRRLGGLTDDAEDWSSAVLDLDPLLAAIVELNMLAGCAEAADSRSPEIRAARAASGELMRAMNAIQVDLEASLSEEDQAAFDAWIDRPELQPAAAWLRFLRASATLRLPRAEQALHVAMNRESLKGWGSLYELMSGDLEATVALPSGPRTMGVAEAAAMRADPDSAVRRAAHEAGATAWRSVESICAHTLTQITGARQQFQDRVGIDELAESLHSNRLQRSTLDALWAGADAARPALVKYLQRKATLLGTDRLEWSDRDAPLPTKSDSTLDWGAARRLIVDALGGFHPDLAAFANRALDNRWVDAEPRDGRRPGGFCAPFPESGESRIFMTFTGSMDNGITLAHELGHAWHNEVLSTLPMYRKRITSALAETASTFAEATVRDRVLRAAPDPAYRAFMLDQELQAAMTFCMDIPARFRFERRLFALRRDGLLNPEQLSEEMVSAQRAGYGEGLGSYSPTFWCSKLHFYIPEFGFYNWQYTFGYLFSAAVYARAAQEGPAFLPTLEGLLRRTGWQDTEELAYEALGVDLTDPGFWIQTAAPITQRVEDFLEATA